jgi:hypothetical protein
MWRDSSGVEAQLAGWRAGAGLLVNAVRSRSEGFVDPTRSAVAAYGSGA